MTAVWGDNEKKQDEDDGTQDEPSDEQSVEN
jgi:hypothetical protein